MHNAHVLCRYCWHLPALLYSSSAFAYTLDLKQRYKNPWKKYRIKTVHDDDDEQARGTFAMNLYSYIFQIMIVLKSVEKKYPIQCYKSIDNARWSKLWMLKWLHSIWLRSMVRTVRSCWCKLLWCTSTSSWSHQELLLKIQQIQGWSIVQLCIPFWFSTFEFWEKRKEFSLCYKPYSQVPQYYRYHHESCLPGVTLCSWELLIWIQTPLQLRHIIIHCIQSGELLYQIW